MLKHKTHFLLTIHVKVSSPGDLLCVPEVFDVWKSHQNRSTWTSSGWTLASPTSLNLFINSLVDIPQEELTKLVELITPFSQEITFDKKKS